MPTIFAMWEGNDHLLSFRLRTDGRWAPLEEIEQAPFLHRRAPTFLERLVGQREGLALEPPFDRAGRDVHGAFSPRPPPLAHHDEAFGERRRVTGVLVAEAPLEAGVVLVDAWSRGPPGERLTVVADFVIDTGAGGRVPVTLRQPPLVVAAPVERPFRSILRAHLPHGTHFGAASTPRGVADTRPAEVVTLRVGDRVEVHGLLTSRVEDEREDASYRDGPSPAAITLGDATGKSVSIRRVR